MPRMIFHSPANRISIGIDISIEGRGTAAITRCNTSEEFNRKLATRVLNGRLDKHISSGGKKAGEFASTIGYLHTGITNGDVFRFARDMARCIRRGDEFKSVKECFFDELGEFVEGSNEVTVCSESEMAV